MVHSRGPEAAGARPVCGTLRAEGHGESRAARQGSGRAPRLVPARRLSTAPSPFVGGGASACGAVVVTGRRFGQARRGERCLR